MSSKDEVSAALRQLKRAHKRIRDEFTEIDDSVIEELLAEQYTPELHEQMKRHGDGQRLFSLPRSVKTLETVNAVVLFAMSFPKLGNDSVFDRSTPLHEIEYWCTTVPISPTINSHRLHFMAWQQKVGAHGVDEGHAKRNNGLLALKNRKFEALVKGEREAGIRFVLALQRWCGASGKLMIVITNSIQRNFEDPILNLNLLSQNRSSHVKRIETGLRSKNYKIMEKVGQVLARHN